MGYLNDCTYICLKCRGMGFLGINAVQILGIKDN